MSVSAESVGATDVVEIVIAFADFPSIAGREFCGRWFSVDADHVELFKSSIYVPQNPYRFEQSLYPTGLVEGFQLLGLLDHLSNPLLRLADGHLSGWNYGFDRVRFVSPLRAGEAIRLRGTVAEVRNRTDGYLVLLSCTIEAQDRDKPVMIAEWWSLFVDPESRSGS